MLFSSIPFLYYFLPIVLVLYFAVPKSFKNAVLFISSMAFYAWGEPVFAIIMLGAIALGYFFGLFISRARSSARAKILLIISIVFYLAILGYFKYADFFITNFNAVTGLSIPLLKVALPIGISFYTFQLLSYVVDVYRGDVAAQKNFISFGAYASMFPQLIAGPIVRYSDVAPQLNERSHSLSLAASGARRFIIGLAKKVLIANALGELCELFKASQDISVLYCWLYAIAFALHIYYDFSGYSDMAIGIGKIFGFSFCENFNYPYISGSVTEFWRRWHMSLGTWFRDYVYIPLGGNRVSKVAFLRNILVVWMLTGFWHGADWTFIIWGLFFAVLLMAEKLFLGKLLQKTHVLKHLYLIFTVLISFVIFNADGLRQAFSCIGGMFGSGGIPLTSSEWAYYLRSYGLLIIAAIIGATPLMKNLFTRIGGSKTGTAVLTIAEPIFLAVLLILSTAYLVDGSFNPFLYFRF